jgi:hypothetical protein
MSGEDSFEKLVLHPTTATQRRGAKRENVKKYEQVIEAVQ